MPQQFRKIELVAPAGNLEKLTIALHYGADAVYLGGEHYGLRAAAGNFSAEEMETGIKLAHQLGKKVYVTVNIFTHNDDLRHLPDYLQHLREIGADAVIVSDPGVVWLIKNQVPGLEVHLSTQANTTNWASCLFWLEQGVKRIVLARELSLAEIAEIQQRVPIELEAFVHGAMCMSYSGRCMLSSYLTGRSANQGECTHPCRWKYYLVEEKRPGEYLPLDEDARGTYIFNSKDLCMLEYIPELYEAGISSFKIEGRMKSIHYVATVVKIYRQALDAFRQNPDQYKLQDSLIKELQKVSDREYCTGFYLKKPDGSAHSYHTTKLPRQYEFVGLVKDYDRQTKLALVEQRNWFAVGNILEVFSPHMDTRNIEVKELFTLDGNAVRVAPHPQQQLYLKVDSPLEKYAMLRLKK